MPPALMFRMPARRPETPPPAPAPARSPRTRRHLARLIRKTSFPNATTGKQELHSAWSEDETWSFERDESPGTPWVVTHHVEPLGEVRFPTITSARAAVADGTAAAELTARASSTTGEA